MNSEDDDRRGASDECFMRIDSIIRVSFGNKNVENRCKLKWLASVIIQPFASIN